MTKEEKELLLKDICARLPYEVIVKYKSREKEGNVKITSGNIGYVAELGNGWWKECKPYLRPMSSMTEEEREELSYYQNPIQRTDFYYSHHIDCRFMIEEGLALEAPEGMYN